jgi:condensin complex subunit 2
MAQTLADMLYTPATSNSTISLPKAQWKSKSRNLLPDDKHFNSKQLLRLFLKPKARMDSRKGGRRAQAQSGDPARVDEAYWADQGQEGEGDDIQGNYDADFFQDDGLPMPGGPIDDEDVFADARDHFSPPPDAPEATLPIDGMLPSSQTDAFGAQLVTQSRRFRPEYVQYARVAKKVDVKRLKDELWKGIGFEDISGPPQPNVADDPANKAVDGSLTFTDVVNSLQAVYPKQTMADISTSYCFICLLHLANEQGLVIENQEKYENLTIRKDFTAELDVGGA